MLHNNIVAYTDGRIVNEQGQTVTIPDKSVDKVDPKPIPTPSQLPPPFDTFPLPTAIDSNKSAPPKAYTLPEHIRPTPPNSPAGWYTNYDQKQIVWVNKEGKVVQGWFFNDKSKQWEEGNKIENFKKIVTLVRAAETASTSISPTILPSETPVKLPMKPITPQNTSKLPKITVPTGGWYANNSLDKATKIAWINNDGVVIKVWYKKITNNKIVGDWIESKDQKKWLSSSYRLLNDVNPKKNQHKNLKLMKKY